MPLLFAVGIYLHLSVPIQYVQYAEKFTEVLSVSLLFAVGIYLHIISILILCI